MKQISQFTFLVFTLMASAAVAQPISNDTKVNEPNSRPAIGGFGDLNLNMAHANFSQLPGIPDCNASYQSGTGFGPAFGVFYELPLQNNFSLLLRAGFDLYG